MTGPVERILAVDDSEMNQQIIKDLLSEQYGVYQAYSGTECLSMVLQCQPDLILLDVVMDNMNGYETCAKLRELEYTEHVPILFLSARCGVDEKLKGYEVGGDDYITKPFIGEEVLAKITKNLSHKEDKDQLAKQAKKAAEVAVRAIGDISYMGYCVQFLEKSFDVNDLCQLGLLLLETTNKYGINCSLQIRTLDQVINIEADGEKRDLESALLEKLKDQGRLLNFGNRAVMNFDSVSLLIKNMPIDDEERVGAISDQISILMQAVDARVKSLMYEMGVKQQRDNLDEIISSTRQLLSTTDKRFYKVMAGGAGIMEEFVQELDNLISELGFSEIQEKAIMDLGGQYIVRTARMYKEILSLDGQFNKILENLNINASNHKI